MTVDDIGMPEALDALRIPDEYVLAAKLQMWLPSLRAFSISSKELADLANRLRRDLPAKIDLGGFTESLQTSSSIVEQLLQLAGLDQFDLTKHVLAVNEDVMGVFTYDPNEGRHGYKRAYRTESRLYWGVLGLFSRALGVTVEGLTIKVLAHEYAHAFTHLGFDRDGHRWTGEGFWSAEHVLKEALAQYYAALCLARIRDRMPEGWEAYEKLLPKQPPAYSAHCVWLEKSTPEQVGSVLAKMRRKSGATYGGFCKALDIEPPKAEGRGAP
jgi:hypothetical protein